MDSVFDDVSIRCPVCADPSDVVVRAKAPYLFLACGACGKAWPLLMFVEVADALSSSGRRLVRVPARAVTV